MLTVIPASVIITLRLIISCQYPKTNRNSIRLLTHLIYSFSNERNLELEKDSFEGFGG